MLITVLPTLRGVTVMFPIVEPDGIVMLSGTEATLLLPLNTSTIAPLAGAGAGRVTVSVPGCAPRSSVFGETVSAEADVTVTTTF